MDNTSDLLKTTSPPIVQQNDTDWFDFETRVRRIIYDLLLPVNNKHKEIRDNSNNNKV